MINKIDIQPLENSALQQLRSTPDFNILPDEGNGNKHCSYYLVYNKENNQNLAVFDLRDAVNAIKHMQIYYSKTFLFSGDPIEQLGEKAFWILARIFMYIFPLCEKWDRVKIYTNDDGTRSVFTLLANNLKQAGPYNIKTYSHWIEITKQD